ncbi:MAG: restriction endonuclease [Candidatus Binatia bacterium]
MTSGEEKKNQEKEVPVPTMSDYGTDSLMAHWKKLQVTHHIVVRDSVGVSDAASVHVTPQTSSLQATPQTPILSEEAFQTPRESRTPDLLIQAAIDVTGDRTNEGQLIEYVSIPWLEILKGLNRDPQFLHKFDWRKLEELVAGAYREAGFEVILTPRSGDRGQDVIATKPGIGSIRIIDQVKKYAPNRRVTADEVRAILGVLEAEQNVSKGIITTTSEFAPGIKQDERLKAFMPYRLELKDGKALGEWLIGIAKSRGL